MQYFKKLFNIFYKNNPGNLTAIFLSVDSAFALAQSIIYQIAWPCSTQIKEKCGQPFFNGTSKKAKKQQDWLPSLNFHQVRKLFINLSYWFFSIYYLLHHYFKSFFICWLVFFFTFLLGLTSFSSINLLVFLLNFSLDWKVFH